MKIQTFALTLLILLAGQDKSDSALGMHSHPKSHSSSVSCPAIVIDCPAQWTSVGNEDTYIMNVKVEGVESGEQLTYHWKITGGEIKSGQGTSTLTVILPDLHKETFTATVEVGGISAECNNKVSCTVVV